MMAVLSRIAQATSALTKLGPIWRDNGMSLGSGVGLMRSLVVSMFLCACGSRTLAAELGRGTRAFEVGCYRRLLNISYKDHLSCILENARTSLYVHCLSGQ